MSEAGRPGFEPRSMESETTVLPLNYLPMGIYSVAEMCSYEQIKIDMLIGTIARSGLIYQATTERFMLCQNINRCFDAFE